jgi:chromosome condensin MukBEF MukE localization factor
LGAYSDKSFDGTVDFGEPFLELGDYAPNIHVVLSRLVLRDVDDYRLYRKVRASTNRIATTTAITSIRIDFLFSTV